MARARLFALLLLLLLPAPAGADLVVLTSGKRVRGGVHRDTEATVAVNPYNSRHPEMVFDVTEIPRSSVERVVLDEPVFSTFLGRRTASAGNIEALLELAEWLDDEKRPDLRQLALLDALKIDPDHEAALKAFGRSRFPRVKRGNPDFEPEVRAAIEEYFLTRDPEVRKKTFGRLKRDHSSSLPREYLDRIIRSLDQPKGMMTDQALTLGANEHPGVYTLFVPKEYDARKPWPLVLGLHGGGAGGARRDAVVGSGKSAMNFYVRQAAKRGYLVVCPTARAAPWASTGNAKYLASVLDEIQLLYHIDLNRVYLTGHSMGGYGAWHYGGEMPERFAAVSPMAGAGRGIGRYVDTNTPLFIFHGSDDNVVGPSGDRAAARQLAKTEHDFIYTELSGVGHGFPQSIQEDLFDFFDARRLSVMKGKRPQPPSAEVRSSFLGKVGRAEKRFLGDPTEYGEAGDGGGSAKWKPLVKDIKLGGGKAAAAADRLIELKDEDSVKPLSDLLRHPKTPDDVKVQAARALGGIGHEDGYKGLVAGLASDHHAVFTTSARSMPRIGSEKAGDALLKSLKHLDKILDSKRLGGNQMHISDWDRWLPAYAAVATGLAELAPDGAAAAIVKSPVKKVIAGKWDVLYSRRVGQTPRPTLVALAKALAAALKKLEATEELAEMKTACGDDTALAGLCE